MLGMFLVRELSFNMIVKVSVLLLIISSFAGLILTVPKQVKISGNPHNKKTIHHFIETKAVPISMIGVLLGIDYSSIVSFLTSYTTQLNLVEAGSFFFMVYSMAILISRPVSGRLLDTKGANFIMHPTFVSFAIGLFLLGMTNNGWMLLLAPAFVGVGFGNFISSGQTIAIKVVPENRIGLATSTFLAVVDAGVGIGPSILGIFVPMIGCNGVYIAMAGVGIIAGICYRVFNKQILNKK